MIADSPNARIMYRGEIPPELQSTLTTLIERYEMLLPSWVQHLNIAYYNSPPEDSPRAVAQTTVDYEYRTVYLDFFPGFFANHDDKRSEFIRHEMIHATWNPLYNYARDTFKKLFESDALKANLMLKDLILDQLRMHNESATTDMENILGRLVEGKIQ